MPKEKVTNSIRLDEDGKEKSIDKNMIFHWWHYYGKSIYTLEELEELEKIIDTHGTEKVLELMVACYICGDGSSTILLSAIRENRVNELFDALPDVSKMNAKEKEQYLKTRDELLQIISKSYQG